MIKYIESHDFHYDPKWRDISLSCAESVKKAARESKADFIATSDFFNRPLIATEQGGINDVRTIIKAWTKECPVVAVEGTPRHDGHGCYNFLEDCGLTLLKPNIVYGYSQSFKNIVTMDKNHVVDCILFGIPELSKQYILSQLSLSSENANAEVEKLLEQYILEYIAPMRMKHSNIPAIGLLHGNVSDSSRENTKDIILRSSDILIRTEILEPANLTRWSLGHIHIPAEMKKICAGYAGFAGVDDNPWGKTKFVPAMNLVEIKSEDVETDDTEFGKGGIYHSAKITRIPYGTPRREKIYQMLNTYYPDIAYWLHSKDRSFTLTGGHPWSRITYEPEQKTTQRAIVNTDNLTDLFKAIDPKVSQSALAKIELLQREHSVPHLSVNVSVDFVTVKGSSFWHGKSITLKISELPTGLTAIMGDNGQGKSSLLAFCSPYPVVIGKDTKSGRQSAIHNFFIESDSSIEKHLTVNGEQHRHLINIKGAHTQTQKVECYLYINSTNQLETTSWDEMLSKCESLYGSFADYLLTTFYVQPLQGKSGSSLMSAGMTDIRNLVQSIAGVDRETEKRYALDQMAAYEKSLSDTESWIKGAEEFIIDPTELENRKSVIDSELVQKEAAILLTVEKGKTARAERDAILIKKNASDAEAKQKRTDDARAVKICDDTFVLQEEVSELKELTRQLPDMRANIKKIEEREKIESDNAKLKNEYDAKINAYNKELGELQLKVKRENADKKAKYEQEVIAYKKEKARLENAIAECESIIKRNNKPCFKCGAIPPDAENAIIEATKELQSNKEKLSVLDGPTEPKSSDVPTKLERDIPTTPKYSTVLEYSGPSKSKLQADIEKVVSAEATIVAKNKEVEKLQEETKTLEQKHYTIITGIADLYDTSEVKLKQLQDQYATEKSDIATLKESINNIRIQLKDAVDKAIEIEKRKAEIPVLESEITDWKYISSMLQANKIPALELESVIGTIDSEATRILEPFLDGTLQIETITQQEGKKSTIDKFDIIVHNNETGVEQSFITFSPGVKAFISDAYVKALVMVRNNRAHRHYSPIISDEADGPIQPERVAAYYNMQAEYYAGTEDRVLVVSHAPDAHNYVQSHVKISEIVEWEE